MTATAGATAERAARTLPSVLPRLTSTRAVAAAAVFVFHLGHWDVVGGDPIPFAYCVLAYFFVLSGFVLTWSTRPGTPLRTYYRRRFARVWPNHLVMLLVALVVPVTNYAPTVLAVLANLFLVQAWVPKGEVLFGLNAVSWSLSVEIAFYAALPFVVPRLRAMAPRDRWLTAGGVFVADSVVVLTAAHMGGDFSLGGYTQPLLRVGEFMLGCVAALEVERGWRLPRRVVPVVVAACLLAAALIPHPLPSLNVFLTPMWLVLVVAWAQADIRGRGGPLTWRWLVYAGQLSFAFYLVHELVILNLQHWLRLPAAALAVLMFAASALGAAALHHGVEQPAQRRIAGRAPRGASNASTP